MKRIPILMTGTIIALGIAFSAFAQETKPAAPAPSAPAQPAAPPSASAPPPPAIVDEETAAKANPQPAQTTLISEQGGPVNLGDPELEPQVTIVQRDGERHEEVRVNGQLRYVRVVPVYGPVYYLIPHPNGQSFIRRDQIDPSLRPPMWEVFSW